MRKFYTEPESTLWITFHDNKLWYCFARTEVHLNPDHSKYREVLGGWKDADINGRKLEIQNISGRLTKVQGFRGTICSVDEDKYLLRVINARQDQRVLDLQRHQRELIADIEEILVHIHWKDFELLIDLLFRASGWSRVGSAGGTIKDIDINLLNPITEEKAIAQVKSQCDKATYLRFREMANSNHENDKKFFAVHSPDPELKAYFDSSEGQDDGVIVIDRHKLATMCLNSGLVDWLITIVG